MNVFYEEEKQTENYVTVYKYYEMADRSVYVLCVTYKGKRKIRQLFCKLLDDIEDYKKLKKYFYVSGGEVFSDPVVRKASESLNIFSLQKAKHKIDLKITLKHLFILEEEAKKK